LKAECNKGETRHVEVDLGDFRGQGSNDGTKVEREGGNKQSSNINAVKGGKKDILRS